MDGDAGRLTTDNLEASSSPGARLAPRVRGWAGRRSAFPPRSFAGAFTMADGALLPFREWLPDRHPHTVLLALHGVNDSADGWEGPAARLGRSGIGIVAPDQRGFGATLTSGRWPGTEALVGDAFSMVASMAGRFPRSRLFLAGESMGAAVLMVLAARNRRLPVSGFVLSAPAVWGRREMTAAHRASLWWAYRTIPWLRLTAYRLGIKPSDDHAALRRAMHPDVRRQSTSVAALKGLADLMDAALATAGGRQMPTLFLYGGRDQLVPKRAMLACWAAALSAGGAEAKFAFYPDGHHLLQRDRSGAVVTDDLRQWLLDHDAWLPSGADARAAEWLRSCNT